MTIPKETNICISELKEEDSFPVSVFPKLIREIINETKATLNYPIDFIASAICFTLSVGIGNNFVAKVKEGTCHLVHGNHRTFRSKQEPSA